MKRLLDWFDEDARKGLQLITKCRHYFPMYEHYLERFRGSEAVIVEVGTTTGGTLSMWRWFFGDQAKIYGIGRHDEVLAFEGKAKYGSPNKMFAGAYATNDTALSGPMFWDKFLQEGPKNVDIVIDVSSQTSQQIDTVKVFMTRLSFGGLILVENLNHGPISLPFVNYLLSTYVLDEANGIFKQQRDLKGIKGKTKRAGEVSISGLNLHQQKVARVSFHPWAAVIQKHETRQRVFTLSTRGSRALVNATRDPL